MRANLTIAIPTYNRSAVIKRNLQRLLETDLPVDIIVSDNASTDETWGFLNQLADERLTVNRNVTNIGFTGNMLKLIELAKTDFIFFISDEDVVDVRGIELLRQYLDNRANDVGVVFTEVATNGGIMYHYENSDISDRRKAIREYGFTHGYMSGLVINKNFLSVENFIIATRDEEIILYPHEIFFIQIICAGGGLLLIDSVCCAQGPAVESETYNDLKYDRYDARAELLNRYMRVFNRLDMPRDLQVLVIEALGRYGVGVFYSNLLIGRLRKTGASIFLKNVFTSKIRGAFCQYMFIRLYQKAKKVCGLSK